MLRCPAGGDPVNGHLITTAAWPGTCPRCSLAILSGYAEGVPAHCDHIELDLTAELTARLQGRATYDLTGRSRLELVYRDQFRIAHRNWPVLAQHACTAAGVVISIRDPADAWRDKPKAKQPAAGDRPAQLQFPTANDIPPF